MAGKGRGFRAFSYVIMSLLTIFAVMPFILLIVSSVTDETTINKYGYSFIPRDIDFAAYRYLFASGGKILRAYGMTIVVAFVGTITNLMLTLFMSYLLSKRDLPGRNFLSFMIFFTMLFSGGMVPSYLIWSQLMHVVDTIWGLILPNLLLSAWNVIMMRTYFTTNIPQEILEAAEMDSCGQVRMLFRICVPLSKPMISTITLFTALAYWNDWTNALYYLVRNRDLQTIQALLNSMQSNVQFLKDYANQSSLAEFANQLPTLGVRMAIAVVSIVPILIIYPFFQKSFVRGIVIGGVKG